MIQDLLVDLMQIIIGVIAIISACYYFVKFFVTRTKEQLLIFQEYTQNFNILEKQIDLIKQNQAYQNQLILEKLNYLEKSIDDIENYLDKTENLDYKKRRF